MIWGMILAAGESKRMGKPKLLLPFGEKTIIETIIDSVSKSKLDDVLVVLGAHREKIEKKIKDFSIKIVVNPNFKNDMLSSVQCGFRALPEDVKASLVILGDQPEISSALINKIVEAYKKSKKGIVLPVYRNNRGHPVLIDMKYQGEIEDLNPDLGLRNLVYKHAEDILEIEVITPSILQDIDTIEDYNRELKSKRKRHL
ncbi:MAG: nucleotidyltransferase family protein [Candidatus Aminicenantes bacterium]|nr:nucleotidyltransferase family protein [Candidatus Aminicenantes bacterium]